MKYIIIILFLIFSLNSYSQTKLQKLQIQSHLIQDSIKQLDYNCILEDLENLKVTHLRLVNKLYNLNIKIETIKKNYVLSKTLEIDKNSTIKELNVTYNKLFFNRWFIFYQQLKTNVLERYKEQDINTKIKIKLSNNLEEQIKISNNLYENNLKRVQLYKEEALLKILQDYELTKNCCVSLSNLLKTIDNLKNKNNVE